MPRLSVGSTLEVAVAAALIGWAVLLYRKRGPDQQRYGSQSAVLLLVIGAIMLIHGLGLLEYRPAGGELVR